MTRIEHICPKCSKVFIDWKARKRIYCSMKCSKLGKSPWNKGKPWSAKTRKKMSESHLDKPNPHIGVPWTEKSKRKVSETLKRKYKNGEIILSEETRKKHSNNMIHKMKTGIINNEDTLPERIMENYLLFNNVLYVKQYKYGMGIADFYLPEENIIIECDGEYWHSKPEVIERDIKKNNFLEEQGYIVFRFSDKEILSDVESCVNKIYKNN